MNLPEDIEHLIKKSGNTFHARVARWFKDKGWHLVVSPYYMDQTQVKAREMDLIAEKLWPAVDNRGRPSGHVAVRLFIECKYLPSYSVICVLPLDYTCAKNHHYLSKNAVAKLFASRGREKGRHDGGAGEDDPLYKAVNQVLNGMVSLRGRPMTHPDIDKQGPREKFFEFPVVVCNSFDKMFSVEFYDETQTKLVEENFQLEVEYTYVAPNRATIPDYFLVDFVSENRLGQFQLAVDADAKVATDLLRHKRSGK